MSKCVAVLINNEADLYWVCSREAVVGNPWIPGRNFCDLHEPDARKAFPGDLVVLKPKKHANLEDLVRRWQQETGVITPSEAGANVRISAKDYEELEQRRAVLHNAIPQTYGEAVQLWPWIDVCASHEWDNRTTEENAVWLIAHLQRPHPKHPRSECPRAASAGCIDCEPA